MTELLYQQLALDKRSIRLMTLLPSSLASSPVVFGLYVAALPEETSTEPWPEYKALSYAWRDTPSPHLPNASQESDVAFCNGSQVSVTRNLFTALCRLRLDDVPVSLWVDAICINQSDTAERNEQIGLMREIFGRSSEVMVWLGEPPDTASSERYYWNGYNMDPDSTPSHEVLDQYLNNKHNRRGYAYEGFQNTSNIWQDGVRRSLGFKGTLFSSDDLQEERHTLSDHLWTSEGYAEAFWRALCGDLIYVKGDRQSMDGGDYQRTSPADLEFYMASMKAGPTGGMSRSKLTIKGLRTFRYTQPQSANWAQNRFLYAMQLMSGGRRMFVTESRRIGIGPSGILAGDRIAILPGSPVPVALRTPKSRVCCEATVKSVILKLPQLGAESERVCDEVHECYRVVSDVFISGVMDGESVTSRLNQMVTIYLE